LFLRIFHTSFYEINRDATFVYCKQFDNYK